MKPVDGGPAFPCEWWNESDLNATAPDGVLVPPDSGHKLPGMTLRDYFAAAALPGLIVDWGATDRADPAPSGQDYFPNLAVYAYGMADEMLKARDA